MLKTGCTLAIQLLWMHMSHLLDEQHLSCCPPTTKNYIINKLSCNMILDNIFTWTNNRWLKLQCLRVSFRYVIWSLISMFSNVKSKNIIYTVTTILNWQTQNWCYLTQHNANAKKTDDEILNNNQSQAHRQGANTHIPTVETIDPNFQTKLSHQQL